MEDGKTRKGRATPLINSPILYPWHLARLFSYLNTKAGKQVCVVQGNVPWPGLWDKQKAKSWKRRGGGRLKAKVKETRQAAVPLMFLAWGVGRCILLKGPL